VSKRFLLGIAAAGLLSPALGTLSAFGQTQYPNVTNKKIEKPAGKLDQEIEDARLRAQSGSTRAFSASLSLSYNGASLEKPFDDVRPNVEGSVNQSPVTVSGVVGLRYRFSTNTSLWAATGISRPRPFQNEAGDRWEANNVMLHLNRTFKWADLQISSTWLGYVWTQDFMRAVNSVGTVGHSLSTLGQFGQTKFRWGAGGTLSYSYYDGDRSVFRGQSVDVRSMQQDWTFAVSPSLQYRFNDLFNVYTALQLLTLGHTRDRPADDFERFPVSQNLGVGITVARDFFLSPNIDFRPQDPRADQTTVNVSAFINL
jgi:hypothetical protein